MEPGLQGQIFGWVGAVLGTAVGVAGGAIGTYLAIANTSGPRERAFALKAAAACWGLVALYILALFVVPPPFRHFLWAPYGLVLTGCILWWNRRQASIRRSERETSP